jgi:hypothetical protein
MADAGGADLDQDLAVLGSGQLHVLDDQRLLRLVKNCGLHFSERNAFAGGRRPGFP